MGVELTQILGELPGAEAAGPVTGDVTAVTYVSAAAIPGALFVAVPGRRYDGYAFIGDAVARGAWVVVGEAPAPADLPAHCTYVRVPDARRALALAAAAFYGHPTRPMGVIGITGPDGKT